MLKRIGLIGENSIQFIALLFEIWNRGDSVVLIDYRIPANQIGEMLTVASAQSCFVEKHVFDKWEDSCKAKFNYIPYTANFSPALLPDKVRALYHASESQAEAVVLFSSGTTGQSKGICLSHSAISYNADIIPKQLKLSDADVFYMANGFAHSSALVCGFLMALRRNLPIVIAPSTSMIRSTANNITHFGVTVLNLVPSQLHLYINYAKHCEWKNHLRVINVSGDACPIELQRTAQEILGVEILAAYGLTEVGGRAAGQICGEANTCGSVGKALDGVDIIVTDSAGHICPAGKKGIISIKSKCQMLGYIGAKTVRQPVYNDWLNTGDEGFISEQEELFICGRVDDMIVHHGCNIYPSYIENILLQNVHEVEQCVVFGVKSEVEDKIICWYTAKESQKRKLRIVCQKFFASYEIPSEFILVPEIPKTSNHKISRSLAKREYLKNNKG